MFESIQPPNIAARLRSIAAAPLAAFLLAQFYFSFYPMIGRIQKWMVSTIAAILFLGSVAGIVGLIRLIIRDRRELRGLALGWLALVVAVTYLCTRSTISLLFPWW